MVNIYIALRWALVVKIRGEAGATIVLALSILYEGRKGQSQEAQRASS